MAIFPSFIFDGNAKTPEQLARQRALAAQIMGQIGGRSARNVGEGIGNALQSIGHGISANVLNRRAAAAETAGMESASSAFNPLMEAFQRRLSGNEAGFPDAPVNPGNTTSMATMPAPDTASARVAQAHGDSTAPAGNLSESKQAFIQGLLPAAIEEGKRTGVDPRIIVAQAAQETGWGRSAPGNNYFGIKSHGKSGGQTFATHEYVNGKRVNVRDSFRQFASPADSVRGYGDFILQNPRYGKLREAQGLDAQLAALQASGYATDPNYSRSVGAIARSIPMDIPAQEPQVASGLTPDMLQQWGANAYAPAQSNDAMAAVNALGAASPVGVAETEEDILAQEMAMMDPAFAMRPAGGARIDDPMLTWDGQGARMTPSTQAPAPHPNAVPYSGPGAQSDIPQVGGSQAITPQPAPPLPAPQNVQDMPVAGLPQQPVQMAQAGGFPEMAGNNPRAIPAPAIDMQAIAKVLTNPFSNQEQRAFAQMLLEQQMQQSDPRYGMQLESDRLGLEKAKLEIDAMRNPQVKPTDTQRNLEWRAQQAGLQPGTPAYQQFMMTGGDKGTNITVNTGEGDKFYENLDKKNAETFSGLSEAGVSGRSKMAQIDRLDELLTRAPQGASAMLKQAAGEYGINTEGLSDIQAAQALINELVPQQRQPGSGPMSDADLALFKQSLPRLINQPEGNKLILDTMRNITRYQVQMGDIADLVADREISPAEGRKMIRELANPLGSFGENLKSLSPATTSPRRQEIDGYIIEQVD